MMEIQDKVILVTGATGNIGPRVTDSLVDKGARVIGTYHSEEGKRRAQERAEKSEDVLYFGTELTDAGDLLNLKRDVETRVGKVDCIVNLVGGFSGGGLKSTDKEQFRESFKKHTITVFLTVKEFSDHLEEDGGTVVNFVSERVYKPEPGAVAYTVSKGALKHLTEVLDQELENSRVNAIAPGTIDVESNRENMPKADFSAWTKPSEVIETILFLISNEAVNGQTIRI